MSYPDPSYFGEAGEASVTVRRADSPPDLDYGGGNTVDYLATGASTDGSFGLYRWNFSSGGPGPHFHRTISESFFILSGTVEIHDGTGWSETGSGDFAHVPPGASTGSATTPASPPRCC